MSVYKKFSVKKVNDETVSLEQFDGHVSLIVNTASKCRFTYQFDQLQQLYDDYKDKGFSILGFPSNQFDDQEPGTSEEAVEYCQRNYGVTFPIFKKVDVNGRDEAPLFNYLKQQAPFKGLMKKI